MVAFRKPDSEGGFYDRRLKIFIGISLGLFSICLLRLLQMQLFADSSVQAEITAMKERRGSSKQLKTLRGRILDRRGAVVAADVPRFQVYIDYRLACFLDDRVVRALLAAARKENANPSLYEVYDEVDGRRQDLKLIMDRCARFGSDRAQIEARIRALNDTMWNLRAFIRWVRLARSGRDPNPLLAEYRNQVNQVPLAQALADLERRYPDTNERCRRVAEVDDIPEMEQFLPLVELQTEDDIFAAQLGFMGMDDVQVLPTGRRYYPYGSVAAQTIGWVGPATQKRDTKLFADDPLASYLQDEVCGREDGVEYACESILRGRRGELVYDIDKQLVRQTETQFGRDVQLTLDIALQKQIEEYMSNPQANPDYYQAPSSAVVVHIPSGDILALVSLPSYDLNRVRYDYGDLRNDVERRPMVNRALNRLYPPGSVAKPVVLIAGLESGAITPSEVISCPAAPAPKGWPNCWIYRQYKAGHDEKWSNNARNATKGSCNIYFSHLADRMEPRLLQEWFFRFGYGREVPLSYPAPPPDSPMPRHLQQAAGQLGSTLVPSRVDVQSLDQIPPLLPYEKPMFGIGQGSFRVTPLQVANAFAALARGGKYAPPRLFLDPNAPRPPAPVDLHVSAATLQVLRDGMYAVVNERDGTAYEAFHGSDLPRQGVKVYGKTGSTQGPENAWFGGFAEDREGPKVAVAVVIESGQHGGSDAGPLARHIIELCLEAGYVGHRSPAGR
jgi:penicillin-binding protein 2